MESLGRCQGQVGLQEDCIIKILHPENCPCHPQDQEASSASGLPRIDSRPWDGCCSVTQQPDLVASRLPGIHHPTHLDPSK